MSGDNPLQYSAPTLRYLGSLTELTLGHGGSSLDGTGLNDQKGYGNDSAGTLPVGGYRKQHHH